MLKKSLLIILSLVSASSFAASFSVTGNDRFGSNLFNKLSLSNTPNPGNGNTTAFIEHRLILRPDVVVDDRFTVHTEFALAELPVASLVAGSNPPTYSYSQTNSTPVQFGAALGNTPFLHLNKAYLDWASDWGVFSIGRMAKNWGLGLLYSDGTGVFDDYASLIDRAQFRALLGNLALSAGYEKATKGNVNASVYNTDGYELSVDYSNPESFSDVGLLYNRTVVSVNAPTALRSSHTLSVFTKHKLGALQLGGELVYVNPDGGAQLGVLGQIDYMPGAWEWGVDFGYASGNGNGNYFSFNPNYRPFLILFDQSIGPNAPSNGIRGGATGASAVGSPLGVTSSGTPSGNGALLAKLDGSYGFDSKVFRFGFTVGAARLAQTFTGAAGSMLGVETDLHLSQKWYDNFRTYYNVGFLVPGKGISSSTTSAWGVQVRGALTF